MKNIFKFLAILLLPSVANALAVCAFYPFQQVASNTSYPFGPLMAYYYYNIPQVQNAVESARAAWDSTDAAGRLVGPMGWVSGSDCPTGQPFQIGIYSFSSSTCPALTKYNVAYNTLAFVYYYVDPENPPSPVSTRAISINLDVAWSDNPGPTQQDLQGLMTHEFGHVLGLGHVELDFCGETGLHVTCSAMPNRETMQHFIHPGETCNRTLEPNDVYNANYLY